MKFFLPALFCLALAFVGLAAPEIPPRYLYVLLLIPGFFLLYRSLGAHAKMQPRDPRLVETEALLAATKQHLAEAEEKLQLAADREETLKTALDAADARAESFRQAGQRGAENGNAEVVAFLSLLQNKGRFIDFVMDDITPYSDAQVAAAARVVHSGCSEVIEDFFEIVPVRQDGEGSSVTLHGDFNPSQYRLVGKITGQPPFRGTVLHRGWMTTKVDLPRVTPTGPGGIEVIQPAEIEVL